MASTDPAMRAGELQRAIGAMCAACQSGGSGKAAPSAVTARLIEACRERDYPLWPYRRPGPA